MTTRHERKQHAGGGLHLRASVSSAGRVEAQRAIGQRRGRRIGWIRRALLTADAVGFAIGFLVAEWYEAKRGGSGPAGSLSVPQEGFFFALALPFWLWLNKLNGLYSRLDERADHFGFDEFAKIFNVVVTGTWLLFVAATLTHLARPDVYKLLIFSFATLFAVPVCRSVARARYRLSPSRIQNALIVGADPVGVLIGSKIANHPELHLRVVGYIDAIDPAQSEVPILGSLDGLSELIDRRGIDRLIIGFGQYGHQEILDLVRSLHETDVQVDVVPRLFEVVDPDMLIHSVEGLALLSVPPLHLSAVSRGLKRSLDIVVAGLGLLALAPVFAVVAILIRSESEGPVFFRQVRIGEDGQPFRIFKFRSMVADAEERKAELAPRNAHLARDSRMFKVVDDPRITRVGRVLRRFSLDEAPQMLNVLEGDMSIVGPRPLIPEEHQFVQSWARRRLRIKPGITGPWQVMGRSSISFDEMVKLDYRYVMHWSLWRDMRLIARTIPVVIRGRHAV
jgi:exopolysaccharide biosynthesis polyprenyl glycosylphosphotransferase